jgi:hypothetical protein
LGVSTGAVVAAPNKGLVAGVTAPKRLLVSVVAAGVVVAPKRFLVSGFAADAAPNKGLGSDGVADEAPNNGLLSVVVVDAPNINGLVSVAVVDVPNSDGLLSDVVVAAPNSGLLSDGAAGVVDPNRGLVPAGAVPNSEVLFSDGPGVPKREEVGLLSPLPKEIFFAAGSAPVDEEAAVDAPKLIVGAGLAPNEKPVEAWVGCDSDLPNRPPALGSGAVGGLPKRVDDAKTFLGASAGVAADVVEPNN